MNNRSISQGGTHVLVSRSLNMQQRRHEMTRIERENLAFAKRLFDGTSSVRKKKMDDEFR